MKIRDKIKFDISLKGGFDSKNFHLMIKQIRRFNYYNKIYKGVTLECNFINGQYIFKASDISGIKIKTPSNYSGELNFEITYITTEKGEVEMEKTNQVKLLIVKKY